MPSVGSRRPANTRSRVDLPEPFSPNRSKQQTDSKLSETWRSAAKGPKSRETFSSCATMGSIPKEYKRLARTDLLGGAR